VFEVEGEAGVLEGVEGVELSPGGLAAAPTAPAFFP
jgi:hypothetical protein